MESVKEDFKMLAEEWWQALSPSEKHIAMKCSTEQPTTTLYAIRDKTTKELFNVDTGSEEDILSNWRWKDLPENHFEPVALTVTDIKPITITPVEETS